MCVHVWTYVYMQKSHMYYLPKTGVEQTRHKEVKNGIIEVFVVSIKAMQQ